MAAKCNITGFALDIVRKLQWGVACKDPMPAIIENYIEHLNCPNVKLVICNHGNDCSDGKNIIEFNCNFNVIGISAILSPIGEDADVIFDLKITDYVGGEAPLSYNWIYDEDVFDIIGEVTDPKVKLKLKDTSDIELLVTSIAVEITDANGCTDSKLCWLTPEGMQCSVNYVPCVNPKDLSVTYLYIPCAAPKAVTIKQIN